MRERRGEQRDFVIKFVKSVKASRHVSVRNTNAERRGGGCRGEVHYQRDRKHKL